MNAIKQVICAIMLILLVGLVGCTGVTNDTVPAATTDGDAQLESVDVIEAAPVVEEDVQEETITQGEHMFDYAIELFKTKTASYEDNTGNSYELTTDTLTVWIEDTTFLRTDFAMNTVVMDLESKTAVGSCDAKAIRLYVEDLCARNSGENTELSFDEYFVKTPIMWLEEYRNHEITRVQKEVIYQGSVTTLIEFEDGTQMWLNYKGIPIKVIQDENLVNFFGVQLA